MSNYNGLLYIFNREEKLLSILNNEASEGDIFFDDEFKKELNGEWSYKFSVDMSKTKDLMLEYNKVGFYDRRGNFQLFIIHDIEDNIGYEAIRTVYCLHDFQSLNEDIVEEGKVVGDARSALELALKNSSYSAGIVSNTEEQVKNINMLTRLDAIHSIADTYGLEIYYRLELDETKTKISKRYVDLVETLGKDTGLSFDFSLNIESIKRKINNNFFTVLYGRGKQLQDGNYANFADAEWSKPNKPTNKPKGQIWVADEEAIAKYGVRKGIYSNENVSRADTLLKRTWEKLKTVNRPKINYEASVYELSSIAGYENLKINLGDRFKIVDDIYNINEDVRVIAEYESILDETSKKVELGDPLSCLTDDVDSNDDSYLDSEESENPDDDNNNGEEVEGEDTLPNVPVVTAEGYFATVSLSWTFENKSYYTYELYASDVRGFEPTEDNKIFEGKASAFLHEVEPMETWYYKVRAKNGYGRYTNFSEEVFAETTKIADGSKYFESAAIKDALIGDLRLDRGWVGKLTGTYIDAKNLTVTDGNGKKTLNIDSFGNVSLDPNSVKIGFNNINNNIQFSESEMQINSDTGKSLTLKNGRLNTYNNIDGKALGYIGRSGTLSGGTVYPGQVFGGGYNCYYTAFGLDDKYVYDTDTTGQNFNPFITLVYWNYNNLTRGIYFNQQTDFNHAPIVNNLNIRANPTGTGFQTRVLSFNSAGELTLDGTKVGGVTSLSWYNITNKPTQFTPSEHSHNNISTGSYGMVVGGSGVINPSYGDEWIGYNRSWERIDCTDLYYTRYNGISTKAIKSDVKYLKNNNIKTVSNIEKDITREDFYNFIKDIDFTTFIYDTEKAKSGEEVLNREANQEELTCGFIMEDIETIDNPVVNMIIKRTKNKNGEYEDNPVYQKHIDMGAYHNSIAIALQLEIEKREQLEKKINELENKLELLLLNK